MYKLINQHRKKYKRHSRDFFTHTEMSQAKVNCKAAHSHKAEKFLKLPACTVRQGSRL